MVIEINDEELTKAEEGIDWPLFRIGLGDDAANFFQRLIQAYKEQKEYINGLIKGLEITARDFASSQLRLSLKDNELEKSKREAEELYQQVRALEKKETEFEGRLDELKTALLMKVVQITKKDKVIELMKDALEFYAVGLSSGRHGISVARNEIHPAMIDGGSKAIKCLSEVKKMEGK